MAYAVLPRRSKVDSIRAFPEGFLFETHSPSVIQAEDSNLNTHTDDSVLPKTPRATVSVSSDIPTATPVISKPILTDTILPFSILLK